MNRAFQFVARYGVPALLVGVALTQLVRAHRAHLTPWVGGGMGMFAVIDRPDYRVTRATIVTADGDELPVLERLTLNEWPVELAARVMPTDERLAPVAAALARRTWRVDDGPTIFRSATARADATGDLLDVAAVRVTVYRVVFGADARSIALRELASYTHRRAPTPGAGGER